MITTRPWAYRAGARSGARKRAGWAVALAVLVGAWPCSAQTPATSRAAQGRRVLEPFDYHGVRLDAGPLRRQFDEVRADYLRIPNDDLLKGFRQRAGLPAPGVDLGGWYSSDTFHVFGQIVSGLARMYAASGDPACRDKVAALLAEWHKCLGPDGYFFYSSQPNAPHYIYDKTVCGLLDAYLYCGNQPAREDLARITDWAVKNLERSRKLGDTSTEWYTLSENLYRAYLATGDQRYRDFAEVWEYAEYWDIYGRQADPFAARPDGQRSGAYHAYSHVNTLGGAALAYLVKGDEHYLDVIRNAYDYFQANQCFATGGYGPDEQLLPRAAWRARLGATHNTFETQCGSWAGFKLGKHLMCLTGDARYGDWIERLVINGIGASLHMHPDGRVFYYSDYNPVDAAKQSIAFGWSCCTGTRPQAVADYHDLIYFQSAGALCVNLYTPATVRWGVGSQTVTVRQRTRFPEEAVSELDIETPAPAEFSLKLRAPGWLAGPMVVAVNGQSVSAAADAQHWAVIQRTWRDGDRIHVTLPMKLTASALDPEHPRPFAATYGPVVLAFRASKLATVARLDPQEIASRLVPAEGEALMWRLAADADVLARPFYAYDEGQWYHMYLDPAVAGRIPHRLVKFTPNWNDGGRFRYINQVGATAECEFEGVGIRWLGYRFDDGGRAEVSIDGQVVGVGDQFGPGRDLPFDWSYQGLKPGKHVLRLRLLDEKDERSKDRFLNVAGFETIEATADKP